MSRVTFDYFAITQNRHLADEPLPVNEEYLAKAKEELKKAQELIAEIENNEVRELNVIGVEVTDLGNGRVRIKGIKKGLDE